MIPTEAGLAIARSLKVEALLPILPAIDGWIDQTLSDHASQARLVTSFAFSRLPLFYSSNLLARTKVVAVAKVPMVPLAALGLPQFADFENINSAGITYKDTYFVQASVALQESLHFHELVHIVQWAQLGVEHFMLAYAAGLMEYGYENSPLEVMAYELQSAFERRGPLGNVEDIVRAKLNAQFGVE